MRTWLSLTFLLPFVALLFAGALSAQVPNLKEIEKSIPPIKLPTKLDEDGLKQWDQFPHQNCLACKAKKTEKCTFCAHFEKPEKCPACKTKRLARCHICAGQGKFCNPLELAPCPGCDGHGLFFCYLCGGRGGLLFEGGGKRPQKCALCKGNAALPCMVCKGKGLVPSAFKGKIGSVPLKKLLKAKEEVSKLITQVENFKPEAKPRNDRKRFAALFKKTRRDFPAFKQLTAQVDKITKGLDKPIKEIERRQVHAFDRIKYNVLRYLLYQSKVLDLCIEREKFNEEAAKKRG
jgi:hypothetical protein